MIRTIRHKGLRLLYQEGSVRGVDATYVGKMRRILAALDVAGSPKDMDRPGFRLHPLHGGLEGFWSVSVSANWRIISGLARRMQTM